MIVSLGHFYISFLCICPVIDDKFRHNIVKVYNNKKPKLILKQRKEMHEVDAIAVRPQNLNFVAESHSQARKLKVW